MKRATLQVYQAITDAATEGAVNLKNSTHSAGKLLYNRVLPIGTGNLSAKMFALYMGFSAGGLRQSGQVATFGLHFNDLVPQAVMPSDFSVLLEGGTEVPILAKDIYSFPGDAGRYLISVTLPDEYRGKVSFGP
jgi:hypothetical protein